MSEDLRRAVQRRGSFAQTLKAVAWSFFGVRKGSDYERDVSHLNPVHVIVAGVAVAALFVVGLVLLVNWIIASGVAR
jgi:membrane-bound acyltransferase YfiQ involved in biofilm formation